MPDNKADDTGESVARPALIAAAHDALIDALAFYADPGTYHAVAFFFDPPCGGFDEDFDAEHGDDFYDRDMPGKRARAALKAWSELVLDDVDTGSNHLPNNPGQ